MTGPAAPMKVLDLLSREHCLFRKLLDRLEADLDHKEERADTEIRQALKTLLPALERHEEIEKMVFEVPPSGDDPASEAQKLLGSIATLREEILYALEQSEECPFERCKTLTAFLIDNLRDHFLTEETRLWPLYQGALSRSLDYTLSNHLEKRVKVLERELSRGMAAISMPG